MRPLCRSPGGAGFGGSWAPRGPGELSGTRSGWHRPVLGCLPGPAMLPAPLDPPQDTAGSAWLCPQQPAAQRREPAAGAGRSQAAHPRPRGCPQHMDQTRVPVCVLGWLWSAAGEGKGWTRWAEAPCPQALPPFSITLRPCCSCPLGQGLAVTPGRGLDVTPGRGLASPALAWPCWCWGQAQVSVIKRESIESIPGVFDILLSGTLVMSLITISKSTMGWKAKGRNK